MSIAATFEIEYLQYLDADGKLVRDDLPAFARDVKQLVELYKLMLFVRVFDGKAIALQRTGKLGTYASCLGHEAAHVAIGSAMQEDDVFAPMYREYGAQFYRGVKPREVLLYWGGDERGNDFSGPAHDFAWAVPIATQALHAAGAALAFKIRKEPRVAVTVVGDGGSSKADFYGAINVTGAMQLPLVAVIVNNGWAISVPRKAQTGAATLAQKGIAAGLECVQADGNDLIAMRAALDHAIKRARHGHGGTRDRSGDVSTVRSHDRRRCAPLSCRRRSQGRVGTRTVEAPQDLSDVAERVDGKGRGSVEGRLRDARRRRGECVSGNEIAIDRGDVRFHVCGSAGGSRDATRRGDRRTTKRPLTSSRRKPGPIAIFPCTERARWIRLSPVRQSNRRNKNF